MDQGEAAAEDGAPVRTLAELTIAAQNNDAQRLDNWLQRHKQHYTPDELGLGPLRVAIEERQLDAAVVLIRHDANVTASQPDTRSPWQLLLEQTIPEHRIGPMDVASLRTVAAVVSRYTPHCARTCHAQLWPRIAVMQHEVARSGGTEYPEQLREVLAIANRLGAAAGLPAAPLVPPVQPAQPAQPAQQVSSRPPRRRGLRP
jgi:hypothetical protein